MTLQYDRKRHIARKQRGEERSRNGAEGGKSRKLGTLVVMDRIVAQSVHTVFGDIFDPGFTESNYGFRNRTSQREAIQHVQELVKSGYRWWQDSFT